MANLLSWGRQRLQDAEHTVANAIAPTRTPQPMAPQAQQAIQNARYGVLANNPQMQQQVIHNVGPSFNAARQILPTLRQQAPRVGTGIGLAGVRGAVDVAQAGSGLYDLATPGLGTNRFSKELENAAKFTDQTAKAEGVNGIYRAAQAPIQAATFLTPGLGEARLAAAVPKFAKGLEVAGKLTAPTTRFIDKTAVNLAEHGAPGRIAASVVKGAASPSNALNAAAFTGYTQGQEASKGRDISLANTAASFAGNYGMGVGMHVAPTLAVEGAKAIKPAAQAAAKAAQKTAQAIPKIPDTVADFQLRQSSPDYAAISQHNDTLKQNLATSPLSQNHTSLKTLKKVIAGNDAQLQAMRDAHKADQKAAFKSMLTVPTDNSPEAIAAAEKGKQGGFVRMGGTDGKAAKREIAELDRKINAFSEDSPQRQELIARRERRLAELNDPTPSEGTIPVFRGEGGDSGGGNYYSTDREFARNFTGSGQDHEIKNANLSHGDIYKPDTLPFAGNEEQLTRAISEAKAQGKKAVLVDEGKNQPNSVFVIDKSALGDSGIPTPPADPLRDQLGRVTDAAQNEPDPVRRNELYNEADRLAKQVSDADEEAAMAEYAGARQAEAATPQPDLSAIPKELHPLAREVPKYKTAEEFVAAQGTPVYHGTMAQFDQFDTAKLGANTKAPSAHEGFFFTPQKEVAQSYVANAAVKPLKANASLADIRQQMAQVTGEDTSAVERKLYRKVVYNEPTGYPPAVEAQVVKLQKAKDKAEKTLDTYGDDYFAPADATEAAKGGTVKETYLDMKNPLVYDMKGADTRAESYAQIIKQAKAQGHDGVVIKNTFDRAHGMGDNTDVPHDVQVVFKPEQVRTKEQLVELYHKVMEQVKKANNYLQDKGIGLSTKAVDSEGNRVSAFEGMAKAKAARKARKAGNLEAIAQADTTGRVQAAEQTAFEKAHNSGNIAEERKAAAALKDPALTGASMDSSARDAMLAKFRAQAAKSAEADKTKFKLAPKPTERGSKVRGFVKTAVQSEHTAAPVVRGVGTPKATYDALPNKTSFKQADKAIDTAGFARSVTKAKTSEDGSTATQALSLRVMDELQGKGTTRDYEDAIDVLEKISERATRNGQANQILSAYNRLKPEGILLAAQREIRNALKENPTKYKNLKMTPEQAKNLRATAEKVQAMEPGEAKDLATWKMIDEIHAIVPTTGARKFITLWKAGLLTGIKGAVGGNTVGNSSKILMQKLSDVPASAIDATISQFSGNGRQKLFTMKGLLSGFGEGFKIGVKNFKNGVGAVDVATNNKLDYGVHKVNYSSSPLGRAAQKYTDSVFNFYAASDRPFYYSALRNNLQELAQLEAKNKGLRGADATKYADYTAKNPTEEMNVKAVEAAQGSVFQDKNAMGAGLSGLKRGASKTTAGELATEITLPFTGVPSSVATALYHYSPAAPAVEVLKLVKKSNRQNFDGAAQRKLSEAIGQGITGTGLMYVGAQLVKNQQMTLGYPTDPQERAVWETEKKQPYSILLGGKWRSLNYTGPGMAALAIGGQVQAAKEAGQKGLGAIGSGMAQSGKAIIASSPLQGAQTTLDALTDTERFGPKYAQNLASSIVPTIVKDVASTFDSKQREVNGVKDAVQNKLPYFKNKLMVKKGVFGEDLGRTTSAAGTMLDPFKSSKASGDNVSSEIDRLNKSGFGVSPSKIDKKFTVQGQPFEMTDKQLNEYKGIVGAATKEAWNQALADPGYKSLDDKQKQTLLQSITTATRDQALSDYSAKNNIGEYAPGFKGDGTGSTSSTDTPDQRIKALQDKKTVAQFKNSPERTKTIGDTFYYKNKTGGVSSKPVYQHDYEVTSTTTSLEMDRAKARQDVGAWYTQAQKKADSLQSYISHLDPQTDTAEINSKTLEYENLLDEAAKYQSYGNSFTKGRSSGSGTSTAKHHGFQLPNGGSGSGATRLATSRKVQTLLRNAKVSVTKV